MTKDDLNRAVNLGTLFLPGFALLGLLAAAFVVSVNMRYGAAPALHSDDLTQIEFLSQSSSQSAEEAILAACDVTGCEGQMVSTMIKVAVPEMTRQELQDALSTQLRTADQLAASIANGTTAEGEAAVRLQLTAELRIADLYRAELASRN